MKKPTREELLAEVKALAQRAGAAKEQAIVVVLSALVLAYETETEEILQSSMTNLLGDLQHLQWIKQRRAESESESA
ncbi:MAG: hypothetical protein AB7U82_34855 [Blastocatellales bacterium]